MRALVGLSVIATLAAVLLATACSRGETEELEPAFAPAPTVAVPIEDAVTLKVMSFNVLYGAGLERRFDEHIGQRFKGVDRTEELIAFLRAAQPDVLAVEEAAGWDRGDPPFADTLAAALGMHYVLAPDAWELHVVLLSKYPIVAADYVSRFQDFNGVALRATLAVTPEQHVNVLAVHLNSMSRETRACQVEALFDMTEGLPGRTILLGDMNFRANSPQGAVVRDGGWQLVVAQEQWPIDQIWLDGFGAFSEGAWWDGVMQPARISDHFPVGAEVTFAAPPLAGPATQESVSEPNVLDYACPLPAE